MTPVTKSGAVTWVDLGTTDVDRSKQFYGAVFGWEYNEFETEEGSYFTALIGGEPAGGLMAQSAEQQQMGMASVWTVFFGSADIDGDVRRVADAGGSVIREPFEIPGGDRIAVVADPTGAVFALTTFGSVEAGRLQWDQPGAVRWVECQSRDLEASRPFYERFFGWESEKKGDYIVFEHDGRQVAGLMAMPEGVPDEVPSYWFTYWRVDGLDEAVERVVEAGGTSITTTMAIDEGRFSVAEDLTGAVFGLFEARLPEG